MVVIDAVARLLPGVLHNANSSEDESFQNGLLEYPQYTRPADFEGRAVPSVLLSGNHEQIRRWRRQMSLLVNLAAPARTAAADGAQRGGARPVGWDRGAFRMSLGNLHQRTYVALVHHPVYDKSTK